jgi:hypothetical protein
VLAIRGTDELTKQIAEDILAIARNEKTLDDLIPHPIHRVVSHLVSPVRKTYFIMWDSTLLYGTQMVTYRTRDPWRLKTTKSLLDDRYEVQVENTDTALNYYGLQKAFGGFENVSNP